MTAGVGRLGDADLDKAAASAREEPKMLLALFQLRRRPEGRELR
jgi:hypothetical protein